MNHEAPLLSYAYEKTLPVLRALAVPNADRSSRLINALHQLLFVPRSGMPHDISTKLLSIDSLFEDFEPNPNPYSSKISVGVRSMSWRKREEIISDVIDVCMSVAYACGQRVGRSHAA